MYLVFDEYIGYHIVAVQYSFLEYVLCLKDIPIYLWSIINILLITPSFSGLSVNICKQYFKLHLFHEFHI